MSDESKIRDAADAVRGIVEAVPVYEDVLQPAVQELGKGLQTVAKLVHVALAPVSMVVWGYDQIRDYLQDTLAEKLKHVPTERIVPPPMTLAGPTVEQLRFAANEPTLRELYANLLATSMDCRTAPRAHPAFVEIIRQLTPDEALLLEYLRKSRRPFFFFEDNIRATFSTHIGNQINMFDIHRQHGTYDLIAKAANCTHLDLTLSYWDNLSRLGLVSRKRKREKDLSARLGESKSEYLMNQKRLRYVIGDPSYTELHQWVLDAIKLKGLTNLGDTYFVKGHSIALNFTALGDEFCKACIYDTG